MSPRRLNSLDGTCILRYAQVFSDHSGGTEQYLRQLDLNLTEQYRTTILKTYLTDGRGLCTEPSITRESHGRGTIIGLPLPMYSYDATAASVFRRLKDLYNLGTQHPLRLLLRNNGGHLRYRTMVFSDNLSQYLDRFDVDLICLHWLSYDARPLLKEAVQRSIPYVVINHFSNARFRSTTAQAILRRASGVAGVSSHYVPRALAHRFSNLSDGVDTDFFTPSASASVHRPDGFVVLLPARIVNGKGHKDLLEIQQILSNEGIDVHVVFAGPTVSEPLYNELHSISLSRAGGRKVTLLGALSPELLRDWYAASNVIVLPSSTEGLGRVLLEAQSMGKPVIAYDVGGTADALIDNVTGFLVPYGEFHCFSSHIRTLFTNPELANSMGSSAREFILKHYSISSLIERHRRFYLSAINRAEME